MFRRLSNLWELGKYRPDDTNGNTSEYVLKRDIPPKPQPAIIVDMETPIDLFPSEEPEKI